MHEMKAEREALETKGREIIEKRDELKAEEQKGKSCDGYSTLVEYKKHKFSIHFRKRSLAALPGLPIQTGKGRKQVQIRQVFIITYFLLEEQRSEYSRGALSYILLDCLIHTMVYFEGLRLSRRCRSLTRRLKNTRPGSSIGSEKSPNLSSETSPAKTRAGLATNQIYQVIKFICIW